MLTWGPSWLDDQGPGEPGDFRPDNVAEINLSAGEMPTELARVGLADVTRYLLERGDLHGPEIVHAVALINCLLGFSDGGDVGLGGALWPM